MNNIGTPHGGGIKNSAGTLHVTNSTFFNNASYYGGAIFNINYAYLTNLTVMTFPGLPASASGNDVHSSKYTFIRNSIIATTTECRNSPGVPGATRGHIYVRNSILQTYNCGNIHRITVPLNLGALTGSPAYYPLLHGSGALAAGSGMYCPAIDQLGNARPNPPGSRCDIGAFESNASPPTMTPGPSPTMMMMGGGQDIEQETTATPTPTATVTATPTRDPGDIPLNLQAAVNTNAVILNWDPPSVAPDGYLILRRLQGEADYDEIGIVFVVEVEDPTTYTDDSLDRSGIHTSMR